MNEILQRKYRINEFISIHLFDRQWFKTNYGRLLLDTDTAAYLKRDLADGSEPIYEPEMKRLLETSYNYCDDQFLIAAARKRLVKLGLQGKFIFYLLQILDLGRLPLTFSAVEIFEILNSESSVQAEAIVFTLADHKNIDISDLGIRRN